MDSHIAATVSSYSSNADGYDGTFTATLTGLTPGKTYVFQSYATVAGTGTFASQTQTAWALSYDYFKMPGGGQGRPDGERREPPTDENGNMQKPSGGNAADGNGQIASNGSSQTASA